MLRVCYMNFVTLHVFYMYVVVRKYVLLNNF